MKYLFYFTLLGAVVNVLLGTYYFNLVNFYPDERFGLYRYIGFQYSPNLLALAANVLLLYSYYYKRGFSQLIWNTSLILIILITGSHTGVSLAILVYLVYLLDMRYSSKSLINIFLVLLPVSIMLFYLLDFDDKLYEMIIRYESGNESGYARTVILFNAILIAINFFPFGVGAANYATPLSIDSQVWYDYNMDQVNTINWFLTGDERFSGIYDTSFGMLLGELGFLGTLFFFIIYFYIFFKIFQRYDYKKIVMFLLFVILILISLTKPIFIEASYSIYLALLLNIPLKKNEKVHALSN